MKSFFELTQGGQVRRMRRLAEGVLGEYELGEWRLTPLVHLDNTTFRVDCPAGRFVLQCKRPGRELSAIRSEMMWLADLRRQTDLVVPEPLLNRHGDLVTSRHVPGVPGTRACVVYKWVYGRFVRRRVVPVHMERVGRFMARLHEFVLDYAVPAGFYRRSVQWGTADDPGDMAHIFDEGIQSDLIAEADRETFYMTRQRLQAAMVQMGREEHGLIHADLHMGNCLFAGGEARAIDFDDCGWGHFANDMGITLWYMRRRPNFAELRAGLLRGYGQVRVLRPEVAGAIDVFMRARTLLLAMWMATRMDNPSLRARAPLFLAQSAEELRGG